MARSSQGDLGTATDAPFVLGQRVTVAGRLGTVRFAGSTKFAAGVWVGVELDEACGKNSGTVQDVEYFRCPPEHGIFVRPQMVQLITDETAAASASPRKGGDASASPKSRQSVNSITSGDSPKPRASVCSTASGEPAKSAAASPTAGGGDNASKPRSSVASTASGPVSAPAMQAVMGAGDMATVGKSEGDGAAEEAASTVAVEKTSNERAAEQGTAAEGGAGAKEAAEEAAAEKAAAEKVAAEKAAAEKAAAHKAAEEKAAAEKAAAEKAAKAAVEQAAADKAAADKVAAERAAAEKAAAEKAAAEKAAADKVLAQKLAQEQAQKTAQQASAAALAAAKAQAAAEAELRNGRQEVTRLKNDIERALHSATTERERLAQLKWRREQALSGVEKLSAQIGHPDMADSEEVLKAQAEVRKAAEAAEKLRADLNQKKNNLSAMMLIRKKLKKKVEDVQDQSQLQAVLAEKLEAATLSRLMAEERVEELKLELVEAELQRDEEAEERARLLVAAAGAAESVAAPTAPTAPAGEEDGAMAALTKLQNRKKKTPDAPAPEPAPVEAAPPAEVQVGRTIAKRSTELESYQEALRLLHQGSQKEVDELHKKIAELDRDFNKVPKLKLDQKALTNRQNLLQERMADLETEASELAQTAQAVNELLEIRNAVVQELRQEVEMREARLKSLEDLVLKLDQERSRLNDEATQDADRAQELLKEVMELAHGGAREESIIVTSAPVHSRLAVASVRRSLAQLDLATCKSKVAAFINGVPEPWREELEGAPQSAAANSLALSEVRRRAAGAAERAAARAEALGHAAQRCGLQGNAPRLDLCEVACAAFRCAATLEGALDAGLRSELNDEESIRKAAVDFEDHFRKAEQKLREVMSKRWPDVESPSQALAAVQDLEKVASTPLVEGQGPQLRRAWLFQLRRLQAPFAYGLASCKLPEKPAPSPEQAAVEPPAPIAAEEDGAMAALMKLQNRKKKDDKEAEETPAVAEAEAPDPEPTVKEASEEPELPAREKFQPELLRWEPLRRRLGEVVAALMRAATPLNLPALPEELLRVAKAIEVSLSRSITSGDVDPVILWEALRDSVGPISAAVDHLQVQVFLPAASVDEEEPPRDYRPSRRFVDPPCWAFSSLEVQKRIEEIDVKQREVREVQKELTDQKKQLAAAEEELEQAEQRGRKLRETLVEAEASEDLQASEERLRVQVATSAAAQAVLAREVEQTRARRDELERTSKEEARRREKLEKDIEAVRQRPKRDEDGRATAPELAALRVAQQKGAQELYALQVSGGTDGLLPLPSVAPAMQTVSQKSMEDCLNKYAALRKGLLQELSQTRLSKLSDTTAQEEKPSRLQQLQLNLVEIKAQLGTVKRGNAKAIAPAAQPGGGGALKMALRVQRPKWAAANAPATLLQATLPEMLAIHAAATA